MIPTTTSSTPTDHRRQVFNVCTFWSPLCCHFVATVATFTSQLPLDFTFATSQQHAHLPNRSSSPLVKLLFPDSSLLPLCRHSRHLVGTVTTLSSPSELLGCDHLCHVPPATLCRFCFHTDLPFQPQPPAPLQPTGGKYLTFVRFFVWNFVVTVAALRSQSPLFFVKEGKVFLLKRVKSLGLFLGVFCVVNLGCVFSGGLCTVLSPLCCHRRHFVFTVATFGL